MLNLTLNLPKEVEKALEKDFAKLEKITGKPRGYHFYQAFIRYIESLEWELEKRKLEEEKKRYPTSEEYKELWTRLKNNPPEYYFKELLVEYIEDMEDIRDMEEYDKRKKEGKVKYYTSEEATKRLKELRAKNA